MDMVANLGALVLIALILTVLNLIGLTWIAQLNRRVREERSRAREAEARAALCESALHQRLARRSEATARGNRTRAAIRKEQMRETTEALRQAVAARREGPQRRLPFEAGASESAVR